MKDNILKQFSKYVSLNILGTMGMSFYIFADTFFIAKALGANGLTTLNFVIVIFNLIFGLASMIGMGGAIRFSVNKEKNDPKKDENFSYCVLMASAISVVFVICAIFFTTPISKFLGADEVILPLTNLYLKVLLTFSPFFIFNSVCIAFVRNDGNPSLAMTAMLVSSISNVILDYIFMFIFDWSLFGAVFATCLSPIISLCILSLHKIKKKNTFKLHVVKIKPKKIMKISSLGFSFLITDVAIGISMFAFNKIILDLQGNVGVAAYGVVANIALIAGSIFSGISQGSQPLFSKHFGLNDTHSIKKLLKYVGITSLGFVVLILIITNIFSEQIVAVFNSEKLQTLANLAIDGMKLYFIGYIFASLNIAASSYLCAVQKATKGIIISISRSLLVLLPCVFVLSSLFKMNGVWLSFFATEMIVGAFSVYSIACSLKKV